MARAVGIGPGGSTALRTVAFTLVSAASIAANRCAVIARASTFAFAIPSQEVAD
jgi:hypothetical protein